MKKSKAKVITITSGKGGVGKSSTATNLALSLSALNKKVCVFDADASLANINILLGIQPKYTLQHLLKGEKTLKEIMIDGPRGLTIIPGATGVAEYAHLSSDQKKTLLTALDELQQQFDYLIIDTAAGIGDDVIDFIKASQFSIVIITPEPTSLTDSFSLLKVLKRSNYDRTSFVVVNMAMNYDNSQSIYKRFESAVKKYIDVDIAYLGYIQVDETMISSVSLQCPAVLLSPESTASECFKNLALGLDKSISDMPSDSFSDFWRQQGSIDETPIEAAAPTFVSDIKAPQKVKTATPSHLPLNFKQASEFCIKQLSVNALSDEEASDFINAIQPFKKADKAELPSSPDILELPTPSLRSLYSYLQDSDFPKEDIREIVSTLEQVYFEKHGESLHNLDSSVLKLFSQFTGKEEDLQHVHTQLSNCYERQFNKPLYSLIEQIEDIAKIEDINKDTFDNALVTLLTNYQQRFKTTFKTKADKELALAHEAIKELQDRHKEIVKELAGTKSKLSERDALLKNIQSLFPNLN